MNSLKSYFAGTYRIRIVLGALIAAVVADGIITRFLVFNGFAHEGNPALRYWVYQDTFLFLKLMGGLLAAMYLWSIHKRHPRLAIAFSSICLAAFTAILIWNLMILL